MYSAYPIRDEQDCIIGGVILINPVEKMQKIIKRYASSPARLHFEDIIGNSEEIQKAINIAKRAAKSSSNVLLEGESGSGKDMFAQAIHNLSNREGKPFVAINCGAIPRELIASELFGYSGGAFTGAKKDGKPGKFEMADGGTVFLDEISEMPLEQQVNLLRVIQDKRVTRIGGEKEIPVDVRIICATNKTLLDEVKKGSFRQDLYYRLNVISIKIPPLRNRKQDIPMLFNYFLKQGKALCEVESVDPDVIEYLTNYNWPGNVRELQNVVERMLNLTEGTYLGIENLPLEIYSPLLCVPEDIPLPQIIDNINDVRKQIKKTRIDEKRKEFFLLLKQCEGNISQMARVLGVDRSTVYRKMKRYEINNGR
jgi:transcriptional regulator with PAS, ATPase and Fis domain